MSTIKTPTPISKKGLTDDINAGLKMDELTAKYGTNKSEMKYLLKEAGLTIKKTRVKRFILADDISTEEIVAQITQPTQDIAVVTESIN